MVEMPGGLKSFCQLKSQGAPHTPSRLSNQCLSVWPALPQDNKSARSCSVGSWMGSCPCFSWLLRTGWGLLGELGGLSMWRARDSSAGKLSMSKPTHHCFLKLPLFSSFLILVDGIVHTRLWPLSFSRTSPDIQKPRPSFPLHPVLCCSCAG